jgi:hypothetical protein
MRPGGFERPRHSIWENYERPRVRNRRMGDGAMETLIQMKCVACRAGEPTVTDAEVGEFHPQVSVGTRGAEWNQAPDARLFVRRLCAGVGIHEQGWRACRRRGSSPRAADRPSLGGRTRSEACIATISSWRPRPTCCIGANPLPRNQAPPLRSRPRRRGYGQGSLTRICRRSLKSSLGSRWSRRWFENPPEGTVVVGDEVRRNGRWEPL